MVNDVMPDAMYVTRRRSMLPIGEGEVARLAAVAALSLAVECQVASYQ